MTQAAPQKWKQAAAAQGFHVPVLAFALRTSMAAFAALALAQALGLEHPHWAAMSAWASSQPMREHLLSRSIYRFAGSVVGVIYAVALVLVAQDSLWVLALGVAFWGALCAFLGNLQRGYMVYGCMLAGYSAAMVVLLHHGPASNVWHFAWDRMWTVVIGVAAALCISWFFAPRRKAAVLIAQSRMALAGVLQATAAKLRQEVLPPEKGYVHLLSRLAAVEELLELYPEGSRTARNTSKAIHWQQHYAQELLYHLGQDAAASYLITRGAASQAVDAGGVSAQTVPFSTVIASALDQLIQALQGDAEGRGQSAATLRQALEQAVATCEGVFAEILGEGQSVPPSWNALYLLLQAMRRGLRAEEMDIQQGATQRMFDDRSEPLVLHRDWVGAKEAAVRAGATLLVVGVLWAWTGAGIVAFAMLGLTTMLLVFSAFESPSRTMAYVLRGQLIGAGLALICQTLVWPWAQSSWQMVWMVLPFALLAGLVFSHQRTAAGAMDTNMAMFILLAPVFPDTASWDKHVSYALAVVSGPALAWVMYRLIYPTDAQRRLQTLAQIMVDEVPALARRLLHASQSVAWPVLPSHPHGRWEAQLNHRVLRLVRWADKTQLPGRAELPRLGLSLRAMQTAMLQLQQWREDTVWATPALRRTARRAEVALARTAEWGGAQAAPQASRKAQMAWQALAQQTTLPTALAQQLQRIALRDIPVLDGVRQALREGRGCDAGGLAA